MLRQQAEAAERDRIGAEQVRERGLELVRFLTAHRIAMVRLYTTRGPKMGWVVYRISHEAIVAGSVGGLALTHDGYLYHCVDQYTPNETHLLGEPLTSITSLEAGMVDEAAAKVLTGSFGPTIDQKESTAIVLIGCFAVLVILFMAIIFISAFLSGR